VILVEPLQHQQIASLLAKNKMVVVSHSPTHPTSLLATFLLFPGMTQDLKGRHFADVAEVL
jgi:hypothetical protein